MKNRILFIMLSVFCLMAVMSNKSFAQEANIHHGFLFFASEKYTVDEKTFGINEDGHLFEELIKDNKEALSQLNSYKAWHTTAFVFTGLSAAAFLFGGAYYIFEKDMSNSLGESAGIISFTSGGGLLALGVIFEFISWGSISGAAETYNKSLMDDGTTWKLDNSPSYNISLMIGGSSIGLRLQF
jgi:hypothetical protein